MVETGSRRSLLGPVVTAVLVMLAVAGAVIDDRRDGAGHTSPIGIGANCEVTR